MSDRVAIVGGGTSGRDHFPFPVMDATVPTVGVGTGYPIELSLADAAKAFYLVKVWKIVVDITVPNPPDPDTHLSVTYYSEAGAIIENGSTTESGYTRESDLVVPRLTFSDDNSVTSNFALFFDETDDFFSGGETRMGFLSADKFYPALYIDADDSVTSADGLGSSPSGVVFTFLSATITLLGDSNHIGTIDIQPYTYWPYAARDNSPIYNTSTGAQLQDPLADYTIDDIEETITGAPDAVTPSTLVIHRNPSPWIAV